MRVIVTGGAGFIGSHLVDKLVAEGHHVQVLDDLAPQVHPTGEWPVWKNKGATYIRGTAAAVLDYADVRRFGPEIVYHLAAEVGVGQAQYELPYYTQRNCGDTARLLAGLDAMPSRPKKVVVASSMSCYGEGLYQCSTRDACAGRTFRQATCDYDECRARATPLPVDEQTPLLSPSIYAITKQFQEQMVRSWGASRGVPTVALRYFNAYGPRQQLSNPYTGVCAIFMSRLLNGNAPLIYEDGFQSRDFISVRDITTANMLAGLTDADGVFNVCTGQPTSIFDVAKMLAEILDVDIEPEVTGKKRSGDIRHCYGNPDHAALHLGFQAEVPLREGLIELCGWAREQDDVEDHVEAAHSILVNKGLAV